MVRGGVPRDFCSLAAFEAVAFPAHLDSAVFSRAGIAFVQVLCSLIGVCHNRMSFSLLCPAPAVPGNGKRNLHEPQRNSFLKKRFPGEPGDCREIFTHRDIYRICKKTRLNRHLLGIQPLTIHHQISGELSGFLWTQTPSP